MENSVQNNQKSMNVFTRLASISALTSLREVLDLVTTDITDLMEAAGCSIYLVPDVNPNFREILFRDGVEIPYDKDKNEHIVVLASSTRQDMKLQVGKAFYRLGEGITGWVYLHKVPLNIKNTADTIELQSIAPDLEWRDVYQGNNYYYKDCYKKPLLIVPLAFGDRQVGVIKFLAKAHHQAFSDWDMKLAVLVAKFVSSTIRYSAEIEMQKNTILELIEIGSKHEKDQIFIELSKSMSDLLRSDKSQIYMFKNDENSMVQLQVENGKIVRNGKTYKRSVGLVGWVYKTGKPLIIDDLQSFSSIDYLSDEQLEKFSDSISINNADRIISCEESRELGPQDSVTFIAVPVKQDGEVLGVLVARSKYGNSYKRYKAYSKIDDLNLATSFARIASNALENEQEKLKAKLLLELGYAQDIQRSFGLVVKDIPKLVSSAGCSIFEMKKGVHGPYLQLIQTSREGMFNTDGKLVNLTYKLGENKTGLCGLSRCTVVVNHYGVGEVSEDAMDEEIHRITETFTRDCVERLLDEKGMQVGLIHVRKGLDCLDAVKGEYHHLNETQRITSIGLPSKKIEKIAPDAKPSWSFAAIPIKDEMELFGVITVSRPIPENPFSRHDITTLESVASRLGHIVANIKMQEERKVLLMTLAHEINTPLTGILADSENLRNESDAPSAKQLSDDIIEKVLRLQLFTETIMGALPGISADREGVPVVFENVNIKEILLDARRMFMAEAAYKGCDILEPKSIGDEFFPKIEMSRFHMGIAIKNIVHNAVKYSYRAVKGGDKNHFINIWGIWSGSTRQVYKINIQNYGVGISQEEIVKRLIFEAFYRGKKAGDKRRTGAGFGLAYARQVIEEMHNGKIDVTSVPAIDSPDGSGNEAHITTFTISLPVIHK